MKDPVASATVPYRVRLIEFLGKASASWQLALQRLELSSMCRVSAFGATNLPASNRYFLQTSKGVSSNDLN
jgi:hypothetical protein